MIKKECVLDTTFDAIIGLAYPSMASSRGTPLFDNMINQGLLNKNVFSFFMSLNEHEDSELCFGWYDESKFEGPIIWYPVIHQFFW
jgi:hypothetical protein